jgi:hypothetical protein
METGWNNSETEFYYKRNNQNNWHSSNNWNKGYQKNYKPYKKVKQIDNIYFLIISQQYKNNYHSQNQVAKDNSNPIR